MRTADHGRFQKKLYARAQRAIAETSAASADEKARDVLFLGGTQWGDRSPDEIVSVLKEAGFVITERSLLERIQRHLYNAFEPDNQSALYLELTNILKT